jgi:short-subunit dehydrogenase
VPNAAKHVLVTGASSGIGAAVALRLAAPRAQLTLLGRDRRRLTRVARAAQAAGAGARIFTVDLAHPARVARAAARIAAQLPRLDALVHAAGLFAGGRVLDPEERSLRAMLQVNALAALSVTRALAPLLERSHGTVVFINSAGVLRPPLPVTARYIAAKHLLLGLTESMREELNPRGIRVTSIYPARTATPMQAALLALEGRRNQPLRLLEPADVAELIACAIGLPPHAQVVDLVVRPMGPLARPAGGARGSARARR